MKIDPPIGAAAFGRSAATFDRPSVSFADFMGDRAAQRGSAPDQAVSFGGRGMFGSASSDASPQPSRPVQPEVEVTNTETGEGANPASPPDASSLFSETSRGAAAPGLMSVRPQLIAAQAGRDETPVIGLALPSAAEAFGDSIEVPSDPGPAPSARHPIRTAAEGPLVSIFAAAGAIDVSVGSAKLDETDREKLRRLAASVVREQGEQLGEVRLNGELLTAQTTGGADDRFSR